MNSKILLVLLPFLFLSCSPKVNYTESKSAFVNNSCNAFFPDESVAKAVKTGWSFQTSDLIPESPVMCGGNLIINHNRTLFAVNPNTGKMIWDQPILDPTNNSVIVKDSLLLIQTGMALTLFNGITGKLLGQTGGTFNSNDLPVWHNNQIWTAAGYKDTLAQYHISDDFDITYNPIPDSMDGALWEDKAASNLILNDSMLYYLAHDGTSQHGHKSFWVNAVNVDTKKRKWSQFGFASGKLLGGAEILFHNDVIYLGSKYGAIAAVNARTSRVLWEKRHKIEHKNGKVKPITAKRFAVDDDHFYVTNSGTVTAYSIYSGEKSWQYTTDKRVKLSRPLVLKNELIVNSFDSVIVLDKFTGTPSKTFANLRGRIPADVCNIVPPLVSEGNLFVAKGHLMFSMTGSQ